MKYLSLSTSNRATTNPINYTGRNSSCWTNSIMPVKWITSTNSTYSINSNNWYSANLYEWRLTKSNYCISTSCASRNTSATKSTNFSQNSSCQQTQVPQPSQISSSNQIQPTTRSTFRENLSYRRGPIWKLWRHDCSCCCFFGSWIFISLVLDVIYFGRTKFYSCHLYFMLLFRKLCVFLKNGVMYSDGILD